MLFYFEKKLKITTTFYEKTSFVLQTTRPNPAVYCRWLELVYVLHESPVYNSSQLKDLAVKTR